MTLTYEQYAAYLFDWCTFRGDSLKNYFPLKGGWEAWVQADYAAYVLEKDSTVDILREIPIYQNPKQRVDWLFNNSDPDVTKKIAIEIKCQSFDNYNAFTAGVYDDMAKLSQDKLNPSFQTCQTGVLGLFFENKAGTWLDQRGFTTIYNNGQVGCAIKKLYP
jgi:hypothetical protein